MSDKSGFFSSVGRFFTGGGSGNKSKEAEKSADTSVTSEVADDEPIAVASTAPPAAFLKDIISIDDDERTGEIDDDDEAPQSSRITTNLRYLSPSALERAPNPVNGLGLEIDVDPVPDIFFTTPSVSTNRKRQLTELDRQVLPQTFRSDSVKRSRQLNRSLLEPILKNTLGSAQKQLDTTWCGELTANHSPASSITNFSLLSRRSGATTNGSLSTRTQEIFNKLQSTNTPAKEIQRLSMMRGGLSRPETWAPVVADSSSSSSKPPPPLKKAGDAIPSRIQLVSKTMGLSARRTPYWRDLTRKRGESKNGDAESTGTQSLSSLNGNFAATELNSLFAMDPPEPKKAPTTTSTVSTTSSNLRKGQNLKGSDGKSVGRNTFKLSDEPDEKLGELLPIEDVARANAALKRGFLENLSFSFSAPVDVLANATAKTSSSSARTASASKSADSESDGESNAAKSSSSSSSSSDNESGVESDDEAGKQSRPVTSAETIIITSAEASKSTSKDSSPKTPVPEKSAATPVAPIVPAAPLAKAAASGAKWECQSCFTSWDQSLKKCGCCGEARDKDSSAPAAPKQLVSNLASFASSKPSSGGFSFGFGAGPSASAAPAASAAPSSTPLFGTTTPAAPVAPAPTPATIAPAPAPAAPATSSGEAPRADWSCPECFVSNKATDDKCPCCQYVKYKSASSTSSTNVFGARAFKPAAATTGAPIAFGVGASAAASKPAFGFGAPAPATTTTAPAPDAATAPAPAAKPFAFAPSSLVPSAIPSAPAAAAPSLQSTGSLFGIKSPTTAAAPAPAPAPAASAPAPPLFGSTTSSLFGQPAAPAAPSALKAPEAPKPATNLFGVSSTTPAAPSLFGAPSTTSTPFGTGSSLFGAKTADNTSKPDAPPLFGASSTTSTTSSELPKPSMFGGVSSTTAPPSAPTGNLFGAPASASGGLFGAKPASDSTTSSLFSKPFGGDVGTTTTDGGSAAKRSMFSSSAAPAATSSDAPKLMFGGEPPAKFAGFGTSTPATGLFGAPASSSAAPSLFGASSSSTSIPAFGSSSTSGTAPPPFGSAGTISFGSSSATAPSTTAPAAPAFGGFGSRAPAMSASSSTNSLFGQAPDSSSNPFANTAGSNNGFNFGGVGTSSATGNNGGNGGGIFQFGSTAPQAAPAPTGAPGAFQFGNPGAAPGAPAPGSTDNAFSYQAAPGASRKMALARRRNVRK